MALRDSTYLRLLDIRKRPHENSLYSVLSVLQAVQTISTFKIVIKIVYISNLARNCDSLSVISSHQPVVQERVFAVLEHLSVEKVAADHHTSSTFSSLAMNHSYIF